MPLRLVVIDAIDVMLIHFRHCAPTIEAIDLVPPAVVRLQRYDTHGSHRGQLRPRPKQNSVGKITPIIGLTIGMQADVRLELLADKKN
jgi:hypothetical protein